jgi:NTE family protein
MPARVLAFVMSGGGARGALEAGALRALLEAGIRPDMLVGTSIGAVNAACLALNGGLNESGLAGLETAWRDAAAADLLPASYLWQSMRALVGRPGNGTQTRFRDFFVAHGLRPDLRFGDIPGVRLVLVATDLNTGTAALYGAYPEQIVLEGVLASAAVPPWIAPLHFGGRVLMDGGVVSPLPIEPALDQGATDIIALDVFDSRALAANAPGLAPFFVKFLSTVQKREMDMELALAAARGVPVRRIELRPVVPVPIWDFSRSEELMQTGYEIASAAIAAWPAAAESTQRRWWTRSDWLVRPVSRLNRWRKAA